MCLQTGFPWLAFTVEFPDRTLDLVGNREDEVQQWFLGVQALAPLSVHHLTMGGVLWQRLIMKLNFYGLVSTLTHCSHRSSATCWRFMVMVVCLLIVNLCCVVLCWIGCCSGADQDGAHQFVDE